MTPAAAGALVRVSMVQARFLGPTVENYVNSVERAVAARIKRIQGLLLPVDAWQDIPCDSSSGN